MTRKISFGLGAIKGVGPAAMQAIVDERDANGRFKNIFDLAERVDPRHLTKGVLETLIKAGALDSCGSTRPQHVLVIDRAVQGAASRQRDKARGQKSLFGDSANSSDDGAGDISMPPADAWTHSQTLAYEKEVFGFYLTSHPLTEFADQVEAFTQNTTRDLRDLEDGKDVLLGGMISAIKKATTRNPSRNGNSKYVNFDLEDAQGVIRCICWPDDFANEQEKIKQDQIVIIKGRVDAKGREPNVIINKVYTLAEAEKEFTKQIAVFFRKGFHSEEDMKRVRELLGRYPGKTPVVIVVETSQENGNGKGKHSGNGTANGQHSGGTNGNGVHTATDSDGADISDEDSPIADVTAPSVPVQRLRAVLATPITVSARPELKGELKAILGEKACRFQAATT